MSANGSAMGELTDRDTETHLTHLIPFTTKEGGKYGPLKATKLIQCMLIID